MIHIKNCNWYRATSDWLLKNHYILEKPIWSRPLFYYNLTESSNTGNEKKFKITHFMLSEQIQTNARKATEEEFSKPVQKHPY